MDSTCSWTSISKNHYRVNLELFLEDFSGAEDELEDDF
jgi:hypothetical protein